MKLRYLLILFLVPKYSNAQSTITYYDSYGLERGKAKVTQDRQVEATLKAITMSQLILIQG